MSDEPRRLTLGDWCVTCLRFVGPGELTHAQDPLWKVGLSTEEDTVTVHARTGREAAEKFCASYDRRNNAMLARSYAQLNVDVYLPEGVVTYIVECAMETTYSGRLKK